MREEELEQQVERLGAFDWRVVGAAHAVLAAAGEAGLDAVLRGLSHPDPRIRRGCAEFLDHQANDRCVAALVHAARQDSIAYVRRVAVHSLSCQRCKPSPLTADVVPCLVAAALEDDSSKVRREAVSGLGAGPPGDPRALAALETIQREALPDRVLQRAAHVARKRQDPNYRDAVDRRARAEAMARAARLPDR